MKNRELPSQSAAIGRKNLSVAAEALQSIVKLAGCSFATPRILQLDGLVSICAPKD
jgi:hypothetical protein